MKFASFVLLLGLAGQVFAGGTISLYGPRKTVDPLWHPEIHYTFGPNSNVSGNGGLSGILWSALTSSKSPNVTATKTDLKLVNEDKQEVALCSMPEDKIPNWSWATCTLEPELLKASPSASKALYDGLAATASQHQEIRLQAEGGYLKLSRYWVNLVTDHHSLSYDEQLHCTKHTPFGQTAETYLCFTQLVGMAGDSKVAGQWVQNLIARHPRLVSPNLYMEWPERLAEDLKTWKVEKAELISFSETVVGPDLALRLKLGKDIGGKHYRFVREYRFLASGVGVAGSDKVELQYIPTRMRETLPSPF